MLLSIADIANTMRYLEFVFLPVDNDSSDLLIHEYQNGGQKSGNDGGYRQPPRVFVYWTHKPRPLITCGLKQELSSM
jgi:hypothetical protein